MADTITDCIIQNFKVQNLDYQNELDVLDRELVRLNLSDGTLEGDRLLLSQMNGEQREKIADLKLNEDLRLLGWRTIEYCINNESLTNRNRRQWPFDLKTDLEELKESSVSVKSPYEYKKVRAELISKYTEQNENSSDNILKALLIKQELYNYTYNKYPYDPRRRGYKWRKEKGHEVRLQQKEKYFGNYEIPATLEKLRLLEEYHIASWASFGFGISYDHHYSVTPLDVIPFLGTGSNGIHFGFLTDFDPDIDLNEAYIVCVAPTYDPPVNIVARNIDEFLSLINSTYESTVLADKYIDENDFQEAVDYARDSIFLDLDGYNHREKNRRLLEKEFGAVPIENAYQVIKDTRKLRASQITTETTDGIGMRLKSKESIEEFNYSKDLDEVAEFLGNTNLNSRLKFYRNATFHYILSDGYDDEIKYLMMIHLKNDGFIREAKILENY